MLPPRYEVLPSIDENGQPVGLAALPPDHPADVFFDMEGYPLVAGGLEYLFGICTRNGQRIPLSSRTGGHTTVRRKSSPSRASWTGSFNRWRTNPGMHIYHYASYEVSAVRRLSTRHDTRQDEVDELLRNEVFVDLYQIVRHGLRIGENSYSLKTVERLYRPKRTTEIATAADSIVQYARWIESRQPGDWNNSPILKRHSRLQRRTIAPPRPNCCSGCGNCGRTSDCGSAFGCRLSSPGLRKNCRRRSSRDWILRRSFARKAIPSPWFWLISSISTAGKKNPCGGGCSTVQRRHLKNSAMTRLALRGFKPRGFPCPKNFRLVQAYHFDPSQECKLAAGDKAKVMFTHNLNAKFTLVELDASAGSLHLKIGKKGLNEKCAGAFPHQGSLLPDEHVPATPIQTALTEVVARHLSGQLHPPVAALLKRVPPVTPLQNDDESPTGAAIRIAGLMNGGCLVIQGPPGTGKTFTASQVIISLLTSGRKIGIASNSHKAVINLLAACGDAANQRGFQLQGMKVGGEADDPFFLCHSGVHYVPDAGQAHQMYTSGVIGGTAWLFTRPEWEGALDFLFIDEAGQVALANAVAMARCAKNLVLLGDQMQLEQPVQGSHPGDAGLSALQYALKDTNTSLPDLTVLHAVVPPDYGLFLRESRRMHPAVCHFVSESMYEGRLVSHPDCARQKIVVPPGANSLITSESRHRLQRNRT